MAVDLPCPTSVRLFPFGGGRDLDQPDIYGSEPDPVLPAAPVVQQGSARVLSDGPETILQVAGEIVGESSDGMAIVCFRMSPERFSRFAAAVVNRLPEVIK